VIVENAGHGGVVAAPIVAELVRAWFAARAGVDPLEPVADTSPGRQDLKPPAESRQP